MKKEIATEEMRILVAAEACLLIVNRPLSDYRHLRAVHLWENEIKGNPKARGSATRFEVNLSWNYLKQSIKKARDGHNLTLHEFAHLIDFADDGITQSIPVSRRSKEFKEWQNIVDQEHAKLMKAYESGKNYSIRAYGGYESIKGDKPEIFSCGTSAFFERGASLNVNRLQSMNYSNYFMELIPHLGEKETTKFYSTVTDFAKFLGLSTSSPRSLAK
jgi:Mlc titration factor MtfA (ptsG expression regulator)